MTIQGCLSHPKRLNCFFREKRAEEELVEHIDKSELIDTFCRITDADMMQRFFDEIFTPAERRDLALRWQSMRLIQEKISQRDISHQLGISLCKITRGAKILRQPNSVSKQILTEKTGDPQ